MKHIPSTISREIGNIACTPAQDTSLGKGLIIGNGSISTKNNKKGMHVAGQSQIKMLSNPLRQQTSYNSLPAFNNFLK